MRKLAFVLLLGVPACGPAQTSFPAGSVNPLALEPPPVYSLLGYRDRLELTSEQVESLDSIAQAVKRSTDPIIDSLRAVADARGGRARGIIPITDETRPLLEEVRERNFGAARAVQEVLTDEQEDGVCRIVDRRWQEETRRSRETDRRIPEIAQRDSALFMPLRGWPWCAPPGGS